MRAFRYLYFRLYSYYKKGDSIPLFSTFAVIFVFGCFNLMTLGQIFFSLIMGLKLNLPTFGLGVGRLWLLLIIVPFYGLFYYYIESLGYHAKIVDEFRNETREQKRYSILLVFIYFIFSIALFALTLWLRQKIRHY